MQAFDAHAQEFADAGAEIIAITGELPDHFMESAPGLGQLSFPICWDDQFRTILDYGLAYEPNPELAEMFMQRGLDLAAANGGMPMLPLPAIFIVKPDGVIAERWVSPDHTVRPEVEEVLEAVKSLGVGG